MQSSFKMRNYKLPGKGETSGFRIAVMAFETSLAGRGALSVEILASWDARSSSDQGEEWSAKNRHVQKKMFRRRFSNASGRQRATYESGISGLDLCKVCFVF